MNNELPDKRYCVKLWGEIYSLIKQEKAFWGKKTLKDRPMVRIINERLKRDFRENPTPTK